MANVLAQVSIPNTNGLAKDGVTNSFPMITTGGLTSAIADQLVLALMNFYTTSIASEANHTVSELLAVNMSRAAGAVTVKFWDRTGVEKLELIDGKMKLPRVGSPDFVRNFTLGAMGAGAGLLPSEVAVVLTTRGAGWQGVPIERPDGSDPGSAVDRPRQRLSGRIFIGPVNTLAIDSAATTSATVSPSRGQQVPMKAFQVAQSVLTAASHNFATWSRVDGVFTPVTHVQVDNAFDTMRSRGVAASSRLTLAL